MFDSNLGIPTNKVKRFPIYHRINKYLRDGLKIYLRFLIFPVASQVIWYYKCIKVDNKTTYNFKMSRKDINYVGQLFKCSGKPTLREESKKELNLQGQFQNLGKMHLSQASNLLFQQIEKQGNLYHLTESGDSKPSSKFYYKNLFQNSNLE